MYRIGTTKHPWQSLVPHRLSLLPPEVPYWQDFTGLKKAVHGAYLIFSGGESVGLNRFFTKKKEPSYFVDETGFLTNELRAIAELSSHYTEETIYLVYARLFALLGKLHTSAAVPDKPSIFQWTQNYSQEVQCSNFENQLTKFLKDHLAEKMTNEAVADHMKMSVSNLFKKCKNESPMKTMMRLRLEEAKIRLVRGEPIKSVALETGFWDAYHFSNAFKKATGVSPRHFLRSNA